MGTRLTRYSAPLRWPISRRRPFRTRESGARIDMVRLRGNRTRRGSALVELSLIAILFFGLIVAIMDLAQFLFCEQALIERVRAGARWGAVHDPTNATA